jgi:hypothetical protein
MLLKTSDVVRILNNISPRTVDRMRRKGEIGWLYVGRQVRFTPQHIEDFLCRAQATGISSSNLEACGISLGRLASQAQARAAASAAQRGREIARRLKR